jgi:hypothetical protein
MHEHELSAMESLNTSSRKREKKEVLSQINSHLTLLVDDYPKDPIVEQAIKAVKEIKAKVESVADVGTMENGAAFVGSMAYSNAIQNILLPNLLDEVVTCQTGRPP